MQNMINKVLFFLSLSFCFCAACNHNVTNIKNDWYDSAYYVVKKTYGENLKLQKLQFFSKDTIPNGAEISFYTNGNIKDWKWHWYRLPGGASSICSIHYDTNGKFENFYGNPFIESLETPYNYKIIKLVKAPGIRAIVTSHIYVNDVLVDSLMYEPTYNDSVGAIKLGAHNDFKFAPEYKCILKYHIMDSVGNKIIRVGYDMEITEKKFRYIPA